MTWIPGSEYTRDEIRAAFPALQQRDGLARQGQELALVLLRQNEPGWLNHFLRDPPRLRMNINGAKPAHNALVKDPDLTKRLFFSENGSPYVYLGRVRYLNQERDDVLGVFYVLELLEPGAYAPPE